MTIWWRVDNNTWGDNGRGPQYGGTSRGSSVHARRSPKIVDTQRGMAEAPKMFHYCTWKCSQSANKESNQWIFGSGEISRFDRGTENFFWGGSPPGWPIFKIWGDGAMMGGIPPSPLFGEPCPLHKGVIGLWNYVIANTSVNTRRRFHVPSKQFDITSCGTKHFYVYPNDLGSAQICLRLARIGWDQSR